MASKWQGLPWWITGQKLKPYYTNPGTDLIKDDLQALWFTAKQDQYNLEQYQLWVDYAFKHFKQQCYKINSDAPSLMKAVLKEQKLVVDYKVRTYGNQLSLTIPQAINYVVSKFYVQAAVYPLPQSYRYLPPYAGPKLPFTPPKWRIHSEESLADREHPANKQDTLDYEAARDKLEKDPTLQEVFYNTAGRFKRRRKWHPLYVAHEKLLEKD